MDFSEDFVEHVWQNGKKVHGVNPDLYRKDKFGAWIRKCRYKECHQALSFGWIIASDIKDKNTKLSPKEFYPVQWQNAEGPDTPSNLRYVTSEGYYNCYVKRKTQTDNTRNHNFDSFYGGKI